MTMAQAIPVCKFSPADFHWVDSAVGGVENRNKVKDTHTWAPPAGATDVFTTWMRFTEDFAAYTRENPSPKTGKTPSVSGYRGDGWATFIPFDYDAEDDPGAALEDLRRMLETLQARYGLDLDVVRVCYSGSKGFSLEVPASLVGGFEPGPCRELAARIKVFALTLAREAGVTIDESIYEPLKLWRTPGSRHGKTNRYKIPLTVAEIFDLDSDAICALAESPRLAEQSIGADPPALLALVDAWRNVPAGITLKDTTAPPLPERLEKGNRHPALKTEAARLRNLNLNEEEIFAALMAINEQRSVDPEEKSEAEIRDLAKYFATLEPGGPIPAELVDAPSPKPETNGVAVQGGQASQHGQDGRLGHLGHLERSSLVMLDTVTPKAVRWLWPGRVPLGKITIIDGEPDKGKSTLALELAAHVSTGRALPYSDGGDLDGPAGVIILSAEDDLEDTIRPRLDAAGADVSRIAALTFVRDKNGVDRLPTLADLPALEEAIVRVQAKLVILDPLSAYLGKDVDGHRDQDVRSVLAPLAQLAATHGIAVVVIRHLNKGTGGNPLNRGSGSIGIVAAARSAMLVGLDPEDENRRVLSMVKNNLALRASSLAFFVEAADGVPRVRWDGETQLSAGDLLAVPGDRDEASALSEARDFLRDALGNGWRFAKDLEQEARGSEISLRTLRRARKELKIKPSKGAGGWTWALPAPASILHLIPRQDPGDAADQSQGGQDGQDGQGGRAEDLGHLDALRSKDDDKQRDDPPPDASRRAQAPAKSAAPSVSVKDSDRWATPPEVFDPLNEEFGFTLDVCAEPSTAKVSRYFTPEDDGLKQSWANEVVWLNPPYSKPTPWLEKSVMASRTSNTTVVALVKNDPSVKTWWHKWIEGKAAEVRVLPDRVKFLRPDGTREGSPNFTSAIVVYRPANPTTECTKCGAPLNEAQACTACQLRWCWKCHHPANYRTGVCGHCPARTTPRYKREAKP